MKIKYKNVLGDVLLFQIYSLRLFPNNLIFIGFPVFFSATGMKGSSLCIGSIFTFFVMLIIFLTAFFIITTSITSLFVIVNMNSRKSKMFLCEHTLTFSDDSLIEETEYNKNEYKWKGIIQYQDTNNYIRIFISRVQAHIIPKRDLSKADIEEILCIMKDRNIKKI